MAKLEVKRPAFQFYPKEWIWDLELRQCSIAARGLWADLLCLMHEGVPYGHLTAPENLVLRMTGLAQEEYRCLLAEIEEERGGGKRVAYRTESGVLYSKRMVRDEQDRITRKLNGSEGGNPKLIANYNKPGNVYLIQRESDQAVKIGIAKDPASRLSKLRSVHRGDTLNILRAFPVDDMGAAEHCLHERYRAVKVEGEWFALSPPQIREIESSLNHTPLTGQEEKRREDISTSKKGETDGKCDEFTKLYPAHRLDNYGAQCFISSDDQDGILERLRAVVKSDDWTREKGRYVPKASKWIMDGAPGPSTQPTPAPKPWKADW